jgi:hypothetical protein
MNLNMHYLPYLDTYSSFDLRAAKRLSRAPKACTAKKGNFHDFLAGYEFTRTTSQFKLHGTGIPSVSVDALELFPICACQLSA